MGLGSWIRHLFSSKKSKNKPDEEAPPQKRKSKRNSKRPKIACDTEEVNKLETETTNEQLSGSRRVQNFFVKKRSSKGSISKDDPIIKKRKPTEDKKETAVAEKKAVEDTSSKGIQPSENDDEVIIDIEDNDEHNEQSANKIILNEIEIKQLKRITEIMDKSKEFEAKIDSFEGTQESQEFYYIDENLQRNIEKLDRIDVEDSKRLKEEKRNVIKYIYCAVEKLEEKAKQNEKIM